jgi:hypothetical protein
VNGQLPITFFGWEACTACGMEAGVPVERKKPWWCYFCGTINYVEGMKDADIGQDGQDPGGDQAA